MHERERLELEFMILKNRLKNVISWAKEAEKEIDNLVTDRLPAFLSEMEEKLKCHK